MRWRQDVKRVFAMICVISIMILICEYIRLHQEFGQFKQVHQESIALVKQIQSIQLSLSQVDNVLNRLNKFSLKLKTIARIPEKVFGLNVAQQPEKGRQIPRKKEVVPKVEYKELKGGVDLESMQLKLNELLSEAEKQEKTLAELDNLYEENESLLASIPSLVPTSGQVTSHFGFRKHPMGRWQMHEGVDIAAFYGSQVISPADGLVENVAFSPSYGRYLVIDHGYGLKTRFAHTSKVFVQSGQYIKRGTRIALVGSSGGTRGVHLHYEINLKGVPQDPRDYMFN